MDLEHFSDWLKKQFREEERENVKKLMIDYLNTLNEHDLVYKLNNYDYWRIYDEAKNNLIIK